MMVLHDRAIVSTQYGLVDRVREVVREISTAGELLRGDVKAKLASLCAAAAEGRPLRLCGGPKLYCAAGMHKVVRDPRVLRLTRETAHAAVGVLVLPGIEWSIDYLLHDNAAFAYFLGNRAVAFAGTHPAGTLADRIGDVMVETLEPYRRRGYGRAVVSATTGALIEQGRVAVWGTSHDNAAAIRTAESLGYQVFCHEFSVRIGEDRNGEA
jgi:GNAT superfamily N-acetyltransferase